MAITLTAGQVAGYQKFAQFYLDPMETVMLLKGYSGTGKSTLISHMLAELPKLNNMMSLVDPDFKPYTVALTATTNQAAEALAISTGINDTRTVHSFLGLRVDRDVTTGKTQLIISNGAPKAIRCLLFIDEASYIDQHTLGLIFEQVEDCKIIFVGDPKQLTPVLSNYMPAFNMDRNQIELTEVVRQDDNSPLKPIIEGFRHTVGTNQFPKIKLTPGVVDWLPGEEFRQEAIRVFSQPDAPSTKILAYRNDRVVAYNNLLTETIHGSSVPFKGQRMICNKALIRKNGTIKTGAEVFLEDVQPATQMDVEGYTVRLRGHYGELFLPGSLPAWKERIKQARNEEDWHKLQIMEMYWIDLRPSFACTVNKSQGSTFDIGFIDLNDLRRVTTGDQLARYMYVATSRFRHRVVYTGDLIKR